MQGNMVLSDACLMNNHAKSNGGGIFLEIPFDVQISSIVLYLNYARTGGGTSLKSFICLISRLLYAFLRALCGTEETLLTRRNRNLRRAGILSCVDTG